MSANETKLGVAPNVGGLLCNVPCCVGLIFSIVAVIVEKENKFIRFYAFQSLLFHAIVILLFCVLTVAQIVAAFTVGALSLLFWPLRLLLSVGLLAIAIVLMMKANNNEEFKLPVIGEMASKWV